MPGSRFDDAEKNCAARAKAKRGWLDRIRGLEAVFPAANAPAITAAAGDCNARRRFFSSSTKTKSPGEADAMLDTPVTSMRPSPCTVARTCSAISLTERFIAAWFIEPFYTFGRGKGSWPRGVC